MIYVVKRRKLWFGLAVVLVGASILALLFWGLKFGTDFTGGSLIEVKFGENRPSGDEVRGLLKDLDLGEITIQLAGEQNMVLKFGKETEQMQEKHWEINKILTEKYPGVSEEKFDSIGPIIGAELQKKTFIAIVLVILSIAIYVAFAFRKVSYPVESWKYGLITLVSLAHDVIIPLGVFSVLGKFYGIEVNAAFIAAMLTILGYSVNDTIVVFDRVRENLMRGGGEFESLVERSINETLARSLNTTITTLLALVAVYSFGGESIKMFALTLIIGITAGAYSSIFIASPLLVTWWKHGQK